MKFQIIMLGVIILSALSGCDTNSNDTNPLEGGVVATFKVVNEQFKIWITNEATIQQVVDLRDGKIIANIPNGILRRGPGKENHNLPWNWHMDPEEVEMAENTVEVCDGIPSFVENDLDEWVDNVGRFCPWSAELLSVVDQR